MVSLCYVGVVSKNTSNITLDGPAVIKTGSDITIVATSHMLYEALLASEIANEFDISIEIIDLRIIKPLKLQKVIESVSKLKVTLC